MSMKIRIHALSWLLGSTMAGSIVLGSASAQAYGGTWTLGGTAPNGVDTSLLLTDGRVMMHQPFSPNWYILTPDVDGNYANGTFTTTAMPSNYGPEYFASAVLADGKVMVAGGEYNLGPLVWTDLAYLYDPMANTWTLVNPPNGWSNIGDAPSVVLTGGTFMLGNALSAQSALLNEASLSWTATGTNRTDSNNEEGWTLLPNGEVLTVSTHLFDSNHASFSEIYDANTTLWTTSTTTTGVSLVDDLSEMGPALLMPNGLVFQAGATGHNAIYNPSTTVWSAAPDFPVVSGGQLACSDAPAALLPNGNLLIATGVSQSAPTTYLEFDGSEFHAVSNPPDAAFDPAFVNRLLVLPSGQILWSDGGEEIWLYNPTGSPNPAWAPTLPSFGAPSTLTRGNTYAVRGTQFNGLSQASAYGDDVQMATNYPLARIQNVSTGHVFYARTHDHDWMGVASGNQTISTEIDVPTDAETGASTLSIVANGIASQPLDVTVE